MGSTASVASAASAIPQHLASETLWYAGYTSARHEKKVAQQLQQRKIDHFLPLYETVRRWNNGRHRVQMPLFPSYVFVRIALQERLRVLQIPGFVRLVGFNGLAYPLPETEIDAMREALIAGVVAEPYPYLTTGSRVEILAGPLQGVRGILLRRQGKCRVVLSIDLIMRSVVVEVEAANIVPVHGPRHQEHERIAASGR